MKNEVASINIENNKNEDTYLLVVTAALAQTRSSTRDRAAVAVEKTRSSTRDRVAVAVEKTRSSTWGHIAVVAATLNCQVGQDGVAWLSADVLDVDVVDVGAWSDAAAAAGAEQRRFSGCTCSLVHSLYLVLNSFQEGL